MECPHCKLSTSIEDGRCALCGWTLLVCPDCGVANETTALHCGACGAWLGSGRDPDEAVDETVEEHHIY